MEKIVNRDSECRLQVYNNPVFHGGPGTMLEMRRFCEDDVLNRLSQAGFENIEVYDQPQFSIGYYWPELKTAYADVPLLYGYILSAKWPAK